MCLSSEQKSVFVSSPTVSWWHTSDC